MRVTWLWGAGAVLAGLYVVPGLLLYLAQGGFVFPAPRVDRALLDRAAAEVGARTVDLRAEDGVPLYGWYRRATGERAVLFFHGNAEVVADRVDLQELLLARGWDVLVVAYRGYPGSGGRPSEAGLRLDARAAWRWLEGEGLAPERVVLHGKSLGGGVAAMLAEEVDPAALVLESTFLSVAEVAGEVFPIYPTRLLVRHRFDTRGRADRIHCPVLVVHGDADEVIGVRHGQGLAERFEGASYVEVPGGTHGESYPVEYGQVREPYLELLERVARR